MTSVKSRNTAYLKASGSGMHCIAAKAVHVLHTDGSAHSPNTAKYLESLGDWESIKAAVQEYDRCSAFDLFTRYTACLCAEVPWLKDETELHTIRASPMFHKKPYFDSVLYRKDNGSVDYYGLLRLIFTVRDPDNNLWRSLVCLRLYTHTSRIDCLTKAGCKSLALSDEYKVMSIDNLVMRVYVVPDFKAQDEGALAFHVCKWKWNRSPAIG
jgi:hypothetical protein